jgi:P-type conjugative transfer ATPase TrbB
MVVTTPASLCPAEESARHYRDSLCRALGPAVLEALDDPDVTEIYVNPSPSGGQLGGQLYLDTRSQGRVPTDTRFPPEQVLRFLNLVASRLPAVVNAAHPLLQAELPVDGFLGARVQGLIPPVAAAPCFNLRKPPAVVYSLDEYVAAGILLPRHRQALAEAIAGRRNILIVGGTASGKTTLANAVLLEITAAFPGSRIVVLEDTVELRCSAPDHLALRTSGSVSLRDLVKAALRTSPDRIVVGEVRDEAALDLLDAWQTGHPGGVATLHADDPLAALNRLDRLAQRAGVGSQADLVGEAIHLVVVIAGGSRRRRVTALAQVHGFDGAAYRLAPVAES